MGTIFPTFSSLMTSLSNSARFSLWSVPGAEKSCALLAFALAPKLPKDAHKLEGPLAVSSSEITKALRSKDFKVRQGLFFTHESLKFQEQVLLAAAPPPTPLALVTLPSKPRFGSTPALQSIIADKVFLAQQILHQLRTKATASVSTTGVCISLIDGSLYTRVKESQRIKSWVRERNWAAKSQGI